jgi:hypothetical protein
VLWLTETGAAFQYRTTALGAWYSTWPCHALTIPCRNGYIRSTDREVGVTACGRPCLHRKRINNSTVLAGQKLGIKEVDDGIWLVSFVRYDLGYFDLDRKTLQPLGNPFGTRLSPMSLVRPVTYVSGPDDVGGSDCQGRSLVTSIGPSSTEWWTATARLLHGP